MQGLPQSQADAVRVEPVKTLLLLLVLVVGCGHKPVTVTPPIPPAPIPSAPAGLQWKNDGYCVPDGIDAHDGGPSVLTCKTSDGRTIIWHR